MIGALSSLAERANRRDSGSSRFGSERRSTVEPSGRRSVGLKRLDRPAALAGRLTVVVRVERDRPRRARNVELAEHDRRGALELQQLCFDLAFPQRFGNDICVLADVGGVGCVIRDRQQLGELADDGRLVLLAVRTHVVADFGGGGGGHGRLRIERPGRQPNR